MFRPTRAALAASGVAAVLVLGATVPAFADSAPSTPPVTAHSSLSAIQTAGAAATTRRIASIDTASARIAAGTKLGAAHAATITTTLSTDRAALVTLKAKIAADTTVATAIADYKSIFTGFRIYAVVLPQAHIAAGADRLTGTTVPRLQAAHDKLAAALAAHPDKSTPALQADLVQMQNDIDATTTAATGLAEAALAVTPADFNANHAAMAPLRAQLKTAVADARKALADGKAIIQALR